jgi:hypothetical protein
MASMTSYLKDTINFMQNIFWFTIQK